MKTQNENMNDDTVFDSTGTHLSHCCIWHGCKYRDEDCPVASGKLKQYYDCEDCEHERENLEHHAREVLATPGAFSKFLTQYLPYAENEQVKESLTLALAKLKE